MSKVTDTPYVAEVGTRGRKYASKEDAYAAHIERVRKWQSDNPEKLKEYSDKYYSDPEKIQKRRDRYHNMDPDKKEAYLAGMRAYNKRKYWAKKEADENSTT